MWICKGGLQRRDCPLRNTDTKKIKETKEADLPVSGGHLT